MISYTLNERSGAHMLQKGQNRLFRLWLPFISKDTRLSIPVGIKHWIIGWHVSPENNQFISRTHIDLLAFISHMTQRMQKMMLKPTKLEHESSPSISV